MIQNEFVEPSDVGIVGSYLRLVYEFCKKVETPIPPLKVLGMVQRKEAFLLGCRVDGVVKAYMLMVPDGTNVVIEQGYSKDPKCTRSFFRYACKWANREKFTKIVVFSDRVTPAWERLFGLKLVRVKLEKEL